MEKGIDTFFGSLVFNDEVMKQRLPKEVYESLRETIKNGKHLDLELANVVADAMKNWAVENGATHYTHWFQPMTGITAEKHDSFISPKGNGTVSLVFSGKELIKGESDASSFPSGGLRATFEARGYTAWDPTSYAFIKDDTLCIPTAFCAYGGEALDKKTPLLRSMELVENEALKIVKLFGNEEVKTVKTMVGPEQEYFLVDAEQFYRRPDLTFTGRTLFGAMAPKGQEMDDHYYGSIKPKVQEFMKDLDVELWKLGVFAKTEHNEVAPSQHELAPVYTTTNMATDQNQLTMELMQKIAKRHGLVCLLHEKPFDGVNGSGKHNNWSLATDTGINLLNPGETPHENAQFLLFLTAVIQAVDEYQDLLRISVASAGNDHRLGANEAPPAVISIFLGDELSAVLDAIEKGTKYDTKEKETMRIGVHVLPKFPKDSTDRNRTSPFAFTGNKFEFRMLGSSASVADANTVLNTAVAQVLSEFYGKLSGSKNFNNDLHNLIRDTLKKHKRILFNGNGYDDNWIAEAESRGLSNLRSTPEALAKMLEPKNVKLFAENHVLSEVELRARYDILLEVYTKCLNIEARTMVDMANKILIPSFSSYGCDLAKTILKKKELSLPCEYETETAEKLSAFTDKAYELSAKLSKNNKKAKEIADLQERANFYHDTVLKTMDELRKAVDTMEEIMPKDRYPIPNYSDLLFGVR